MTEPTKSPAADPVAMPAPRIRERVLLGAPGGPMFVLCALVIALGVVWLTQHFAAPVVGVLVVAVGILGLTGLTPIAPGQARVVQLFGRYVGTARKPGLRWFNPLTRRRPVSTRIRNHETGTTKVNDADGNPIEIAAVVVWQIQDTARAVYEVDDFTQFVNIQAETAVRHIATSYPYDAGGEDRLSLRDNAAEITAKLSAEIAQRVESAGVAIIESRLTRLAYAPEIASAMLRRQQANAVVAARQRIVEGAVGMVQLALSRLEEQDVVSLDDERRAAMVSNLLVVLCGDRDTQPVVNTGSLYQ
ncbi:MAG TPA: SPFH domain-containing protein [Pseudonocardiaceae bacterium]|jgi:regulator of protease activity HflC (stomatin/prohibitin superfamily)|nr:SPFH domain-containing protein [Pseudonocardiaceae bacterium]